LLTFYSRLEDELEYLLNAKHENVVHVLGWTMVDESFSIIVECMHYGTLDHLLSQNAPLTPLLRFRMCYDVSCGIAHLHNLDAKKGLIHGNIHPENIFLSERLTCKLAGFEFVTLCPHDESHFHSKSVPVECNHIHKIYIPPEAVDNPSIIKTLAYDVFSFVVVVTQLLGWENNSLNKEQPQWLKIIENGNADLYKNMLGEMINEDNPNTKVIHNNIINVLEACWEEAIKRPSMIEIERNFERFWKICDTSQIENKVDEVIQELVSRGRLMQTCSNRLVHDF